MRAGTPMYEAALRRVLDSLADRFGDGFSRREIAALVERKRAELESTGQHPEFVPALVDHWVRDQLLAAARAQGRPLSPRPKLLFVCEHGEGRSQVAAAIAEHLSDGHVLARSGGLRPTGRLNPHATEVLAERGVVLHNPLPADVHEDALDAADVIVLIGCEPDQTHLTGRRTVRWDVDDPYAVDLPTARRIADELEARVRALLAELGVPARDQPGQRVASATATG
ncbi:low molecular weight phosphatase family protein [Ornithinimicrobium tianjinense]|uniref:Phosphotyrosine protein phosphatase I domain-containing protein n=1 Tax=Ornithinimicrobium tianjinense TaxID=1195761 RepID=A0A917BMM8_9MICO|nr:low molecular weight phosphatase family protein [Ornithinimicrobium tianjinense]GGF50873.1 hypothetical protein GCM10011366_18390 [Ornithinimicrobium tianjinense]